MSNEQPYHHNGGSRDADWSVVRGQRNRQLSRNETYHRRCSPWDRSNVQQGYQHPSSSSSTNRSTNSQRNTGYNRQRGSGRRRHNSHGGWNRNETHASAGGDGVVAIPGYVTCPQTGKLFKIATEGSGLNGFTKTDIDAKRIRERNEQLAASRPRYASGSFVMRPVIRPISSMMNDLSMGSKAFSSTTVERRIAESRMLNTNKCPNTVQKTPLADYVKVHGCQFLTVSEDGKSVFGCWSTSGYRSASAQCSHLLTLSAVIDEDARRKAIDEDDCRSYNPANAPLNTMGLKFDCESFTENSQTTEPSLVDICMAPVDSEVTCCLFVGAAVRRSRNDIMVVDVSINLHPVNAWSKPDFPAVLDSPIYNMYKHCYDDIFCCGWSGNKMRISLGLVENAKIYDVLSEQHFTISSKKKTVLSQSFSPDGDLIYMGLRDGDVIQSDLRMHSQHVTAHYNGSKNAGFIKVLKEQHAGKIVTETFQGEVKLWDTRRPDKPILNCYGHVNDHWRLPCYVDNDEQFVFAFGSDGYARGWSLLTGDMLCSLPCPRPADTECPRIVYSDCWGGQPGNSAIVLAVGDTFRVHQLDL